MNLNTIYQNIVADLENEMGVKIPSFGKSFIRAIAIVQAAKLYIYYLSLDFVSRNTLPDTADSAEKGGTLQRWGRIVLGRYQFAATQGEYEIEVTGATSSVIPANTVFQSSSVALSPRKLFVLDSQVTLSQSPEVITVRALEAGRGSQLEVGDGFSLTAPIPGIDKFATVTDEITEPVDGETKAQYRERILEAFQTEPQGGAAVDYRLWANEVDGVRQSYPYAALGTNVAGNVDVYVQATPAASSDGYGTPTTATLNLVEDAIELNPDTNLPMSERGRQPLGVIVNVQPVDVEIVEIDIENFVDLTSAKQASIRAAITEVVNNIQPFVDAVDVEDDRNDTLTLNAIISAITIAVPGAVFGTVTMRVNGTVTTSKTFLRDNVPFTNDGFITFI